MQRDKNQTSFAAKICTAKAEKSPKYQANYKHKTTPKNKQTMATFALKIDLDPCDRSSK